MLRKAGVSVLSGRLHLDIWGEERGRFLYSETRICKLNIFNTTGVANPQDHNLYTYDMRKLDRAVNVHKDHVSAGWCPAMPTPFRSAT